jgi:hypothetical protein
MRAVRRLGHAAVVAATVVAVMLLAPAAAATPAGVADPAGAAASSPSADPSQPSLEGKTTLPAGSLVGTGGFEPPDVEEVSGYDTYTAAQYPDLGDWTITAGSVDLIGAGWEDAAEGAQYIDLNGNEGDGTAAKLTQTLDTTPGRRYRLEFLLAGNPHGDPPVKNLDVQLGTVTKSYTTDAADGGDTLNWRTVDLEADDCSAPGSSSESPSGSSSGSSSGTVLTFTSRTEGQRGPLIDAVSVVDVGAATACGAAGAVLWQVLLLSGLGVVWVAAMVVLGWAILRRTGSGRPAGIAAH